MFLNRNTTNYYIYVAGIWLFRAGKIEAFKLKISERIKPVLFLVNQQDSQQVFVTQPFSCLLFSSVLGWLRMGENPKTSEEGTADLRPWLGRTNGNKQGLWSWTHVSPSFNTFYSLK